MKIIGHRGARGLAPENTLKSLEKALEHKVDEIEFDVRVTGDDVPVLVHHAIIKDAAGNWLHVADHTLVELREHKADLPSLAEAIEFVDRRVPLLIEVKLPSPTKPVTDVLQLFLDRGWQPSDFLLGSKSQRTLLALHREAPEVGKVVIEGWSGIRAQFRAKQVNTKRLNMRSWWLWSGFLKAMHRRGYQIAPYTMNNPAKVRAWQPYIHSVITDLPDLFEKTEKPEKSKRSKKPSKPKKTR